MTWRGLNNVLHRDVGYLIVGLTLVFGVSGLALNHAADWNPSYRRTKTTMQISPLTALEREAQVQEALPQLGVTEAPRNSFRPDEHTLQIFFKDNTYAIDIPTGKVVVDQVRTRPVLFEVNQMHLNASKGLWTWIADVYAVALIFMAISGMFVLRGKTGITGRGAWLVTIGVAIPVLFWWFLA